MGGKITNMGVGEQRVAEKPELEDVEEIREVGLLKVRDKITGMS